MPTAINLWGADGLAGRAVKTGAGTAIADYATTWYAYDHHPSLKLWVTGQGTVAQRFNADGTLTSIYACDAFGNKLAGTEEVYNYNAKYGYYFDAETGFYYCMHRYYDPANGRWLTEDPIGFEGGLNLYGYCGNGPVGSVDWSGLKGFGRGIDDLSIDKQGTSLMNWYMGGNGQTRTFVNDPLWTEYMEFAPEDNDGTKENRLVNVVANEVKVIGIKFLQSGKSSTTVSTSFHIGMDFSERKTGYALMNGSNSNFGDFQIAGTMYRDKEGNVICDLRYTFNDWVNFNPQYDTDTAWDKITKFFSRGKARPYELHISWDDLSIMNNKGKFSDGWLGFTQQYCSRCNISFTFKNFFYSIN